MAVIKKRMATSAVATERLLSNFTSTNFLRDFAGKGMLNDLMESYQSDICDFRAMTLSSLHLVANWPVFTTNQ